jgi:Cys-rich repeat protein
MSFGPPRSAPCVAFSASTIIACALGACDRQLIELLDEAPQGGPGGGEADSAGSAPVVAPDPEPSDDEPECASDTDCSPPQVHCNERGGCVECLSDSDCPWQMECDSTTRSCVQCQTDQECLQGMVCDAETASCALPCTSNQFCFGVFPYCDPARGVCVQCVADTDCNQSFFGPGSSCHRGLCVQCFTDADCAGERPYCDPGSRTCAGCLDNNHCAIGSVCSPFERQCRQ